MDNGKHAYHSMPLVSRLDHLEFLMKNLESKQNSAKFGGNNNNNVEAVDRQYLPLNLAVREAYFKGSLLDRVASLENRLFQLCLELESGSRSCTSSGTSGDASSSQGSKKEVASLLPTFGNNQYQGQKQDTEVLANRSDVQGKYSKVQQKGKHANPIKQNARSKPNGDDKTCKDEKKRVSSNWPHLKLFGC